MPAFFSARTYRPIMFVPLSISVHLCLAIAVVNVTTVIASPFRDLGAWNDNSNRALRGGGAQSFTSLNIISDMVRFVASCASSARTSTPQSTVFALQAWFECWFPLGTDNYAYAFAH